MESADADEAPEVPGGGAVDASAKASISCVKQQTARPVKSSFEEFARKSAEDNEAPEVPDSGAVGGRRSRRCEREREHQLRGAAYGVSGDAAAPKSSYSEVSYGTVRRRGGTGGAKRRRCRCEREGKHQLREAAGDASAQESSFHDPPESEGDNGAPGVPDSGAVHGR